MFTLKVCESLMCLYFILNWALEELRNLRFFRGSKLGVSLRIRRLPVQFPLSKSLEVVNHSILQTYGFFLGVVCRGMTTHCLLFF